MTALFYACFGLCIVAGGLGARFRRLDPRSAWRIPIDGIFFVSTIALLHLGESWATTLGATFTGSLSVAMVLIGMEARLLVLQRIIWLLFAAAFATASLLLLTL